MIRRAFVFGAHMPTGGGRMLYALAQLLSKSLGVETRVVNLAGETPDINRFGYPDTFDVVSVPDVLATARPSDIVIMSPAASHLWVGPRLNCVKLMFIQGFSTFQLLDCFFDHYVFVSRYCRDFIHTAYGVDGPIIPPFIEPAPVGAPWELRPPRRVLVHTKNNDRLLEFLLETIVRDVTAAFPDVAFNSLWGDGPLQHAALRSRLSGSRHLLVLSAAEGFGLVPLEAMSAKVAVTGLDGFGGREYMRPGENCMCLPLAEAGRIAPVLVDLLATPDRAKALGEAGAATAPLYDRAQFEWRWTNYLGGLTP